MTRPLQKMLTKNSPTWATKQTEAIKSLKKEIQKPTNTAEGAILFEEINGKRQICGYKSGRFKDSEMHYHSTFKEILAVKKAIEKFEFHLIGHKFRIEMDMSSFPKMLQFKQKMVPHQQLLRWSEWFSKLSRGTRGNTELLPALLYSRFYRDVRTDSVFGQDDGLVFENSVLKMLMQSPFVDELVSVE
ncbi:hypothetical protein EUTSA_v10003399mg, partial [Eutrema salsugineum]